MILISHVMFFFICHCMRVLINLFNYPAHSKHVFVFVLLHLQIKRVQSHVFLSFPLVNSVINLIIV